MLRAGGGAGMRGEGKNPWRRLWQVPLLLAGLALFGFGVRAFVRTIKPVAFQEQVRGIRSLLTLEQYGEAVAEINRLAPYYGQPREQGELQVLAGDAHYLVQRQQGLVRENYERVLRHYEKAVAFGIAPDAGVNERWGIAALALGNATLAVEKLEAAAALDPALLQAHAREMVNAYAGVGQLEKARDILERLLAAGEGSGTDSPAAREGPKPLTRAETVDNRVWALCKQIELALAEPGRGGGAGRAGSDHLQRAIAQAQGVLKDLPEQEPAGRILTWIGRGELQRGDVDAAQAALLGARAKFHARNLDDGRAAVLLAKIAEARNELDRAGKLYEEVATTHEGTAVWAAARLGRAEVAVRQALLARRRGTILTAGMLEDYRFALAAVSPAADRPAELINRESVQALLAADHRRAADAGDLPAALTFLALQQEMAAAAGERETEALAFQLATTRERRADELMGEAAKRGGGGGGAATEERRAMEEEARALYAQAAADYQRHAHLATMQDEVSGESLWKAAQLYDQAGEPMKSVVLYEQFTRQRPRDPRIPEALLATGRLYQSAGMLEKAIAAYERNMQTNGKTPAAYTSAVNVARCYMALADASLPPPHPSPMTPPIDTASNSAASQPGASTMPGGGVRQAYFEKAEAALLALVQNNTDLLPAANEFRVSLFTLGELYFRNGRWADAILRLEEATQRYPQDEGLPRALFLLGESYRKSAEEIGEAIGRDPAITGRDLLETARAERLGQAAGLFTRVIGLLDPEGNGTAASDAGGRGARSALEEAYVRNSHMNRAACFYDRGEYAAAIKLYDEAATRFSEEALAARAYVQIVNAYLALKEPTQAAAAAERGRWILKRIPDEAFTATRGETPGMDRPRSGRAYYDRLLTLGGSVPAGRE